LTLRTSTSTLSQAPPNACHFHIRPAEWIFFFFFSFLSFATTTAAFLADHYNALHAATLATTATSTPLSARRAPLWRLLPHQLPFQHAALLLGSRLHLNPSLLLHRPLDAMGGVISRTGFLPLWGLPCTSEFFCWPLRRRMRSQYTPIYYRRSPVPSIELSTYRCSLYLQL
jgi:hypothetical protein